MEIIPGRIYKHFKGDLYLVEDFVLHSETKEKMVLYRALYGKGLRYVRPYEMFKEKVDKVKYPNPTFFKNSNRDFISFISNLAISSFSLLSFLKVLLYS